jgi:hypothetical protein
MFFVAGSDDGRSVSSLSMTNELYAHIDAAAVAGDNDADTIHANATETNWAALCGNDILSFVGNW